MTKTISITQGIGYTGKMGNRAWIAEITGTDSQYGLSREFIDADDIERDHFGRRRYIRTYHYELGPGLYEVCEHGDRWFRIVWADGSKWAVIAADRAEAIAKMMDGGAEYEAARRATKAEVAA